MLCQLFSGKRFVFLLVLASCLTLSCGGGGGGSSQTPDQLPTGTILVYGDSRTNNAIHQQLVDLMTRVGPSAVFHTGDLVADGREAAQWSTFNNIIANLVASDQFFPALGNHERESELFFTNFPHLGLSLAGAHWYWVEKNGIHFIVLDTNYPFDIGSDQYQWLQNDLQAIDHNDIQFVVVLFHHPPYTTGPHAEDLAVQQNLVPLFLANDVDLVFSGDNHCYERSLVNGIYYLVTGGGGAPLYDQERQSQYSQKYRKVYHFCSLEVVGGQLIVEVFDINSLRRDRVVINST